jgi:peptidoglycan-associated lipoprotein
MSADELDRLNLLGEIPFDYDTADIRADARAVLGKNVEVLRRLDFLRVTIEGHCDERGTVEYNLALGQRRALAAYDYVVSLGAPADRLLATSYGKESPVCSESTEECWARNRRARFKVTGTAGRD